METVTPNGLTIDRESAWLAQLRLTFARCAERGTRLVQCAHTGPLRVQRPFYPEGADCAHVYVLHPPGGLVSGDTLNIHVDIDAGSAALLTTPGAGRIYRARSGHSRQRQNVWLRIAERGCVEWLPLETIVFDGADVVLNTHVDLAADASFCAWEVVCLGRQAGEQPFRRGSLQQQWRIDRGGKPVWRERLDLDAGGELMRAAWGLGNAPVYGTLLAISPTSAASLLEPLRQIVSDSGCNEEAAVTMVRGVVAVRYRGDSGERARQLFRRCWEQLRPWLCGRSACAPRIWNT